MITKVIAVLCLLCVVMPAFALSLPPRLMPLPTIGGNAEAVTNFANIEQDDLGRVCFAELKSGLFCYDGADLERVYDGYASSLISIGEGRDRFLVFGGRDELLKLHRGQVSSFVPDASFSLGIGEYIVKLDTIDSNSFFVITNRTLYRYLDMKMKAIYHYQHGLNPNYASALDENTIQLAETTGLKRIDRDGNILSISHEDKNVYFFMDDLIFTSAGIFKGDEHLTDGQFHFGLKRSNGQIIAAGNRGLCLVGKRVMCPANSSTKVYKVFEDSNENIWASTNNGLQYAPKRLYTLLNEAFGLSHDNVLSVVKGKNEIFAGTLKGVNVIDQANNKITVLDGTQDLQVRSLLLDNEQLWIGTIANGLYVYDLVSGRVQQHINLAGRIVSLLNYNEEIWAATQYRGIYRLDAKGYLLSHINQPVFEGVRKIATCGNDVHVGGKVNGLIKLDKRGEIVNYTNKKDFGVFACDPETSALASASEANSIFKMTTDFSTVSTGYGDHSIKSMFFKEGSLWTLSSEGLAQWNDSGIVLQYRTSSLNFLYLNIMLLDGSIIYAGSTKGLVVLDMNALQSSKYLPPSVTLNTVDDVNGNLTIEPRSSNLADYKNTRIYFKLDTQETFTALRWGENIVFPFIPYGHVLSIYAVDQFNHRSELLDYNFSSGPISALISDPHPLSMEAVFNIILVLLLFVLALLSIYLYFANRKALALERTNSADSDANNTANLLHDSQAFATLQAKIESDPDCYGQYSRRVIACNNAIKEKGRCDRAKILAKHSDMDAQVLRAAIRKIFGSGSIKDYVDMYCRYLEQCGGI